MLTYSDECHHAASDTISKVLQEIKARYVYGVTATPIRGDGLERINYILLGPSAIGTHQRKEQKHKGLITWYIPDLQGLSCLVE